MIAEVDDAVLDRFRLLEVPGKEFKPNFSMATVRKTKDGKTPGSGLVVRRTTVTPDPELARPQHKVYDPLPGNVTITLPDGSTATGPAGYIVGKHPEPHILVYECRWWGADYDLDVVLSMQLPRLFSIFDSLTTASGSKVFVERGQTINLDNSQTGVFEKMFKLTVKEVWLQVDEGKRVSAITHEPVVAYQFQ